VAGGSATLWSGFDGAALRTWDVDVANINQVGVPLVAGHLDGIALTFDLSLLGAGRIELATRGVLSFVDAPPTLFKTGNPDTPVVERMRIHRIVVDDVSAIVPDPAQAPIAIGGTDCTLEARVVAR
jgi:hypothetical protein